MGKNHRHKKQLKSERAKVKLKGSKTKFLPKGQNVTNTNFKIKQIVIQEQLKVKSSGKALDVKNIKEILNYMKHNNLNIRHDNCLKLKDVIHRHHGDELVQHLDIVFRGICPLFLDKEAKIRKVATDMIKVILQFVNANYVEPFFEIISPYLRCAMSNINQLIQEDSLMVLDIVLERIPALVVSDAEKYLNILFSLVSKLKINTVVGRTLSINMNSKYTSVRWRVAILERLKGIFEAVVMERNLSVERREHKTQVIDTSNESYVPLYSNQFDQKSHVDVYSKIDQEITEDAVMKVKTYINTLMPLLYESWLEVAPTNSGGSVNSTNVILRDEAATTLSCVLSVVYLLWDLSVTYEKERQSTGLKNLFRSSISSKLFKSLLSVFPFTRYDTGNRNVHTEIMGKTTGSKCLRENLLICYIFAGINIKVNEVNKIESAKKIVDYITYSIFNKKHFGGGNFKLLINVVEQILGENFQFWEESVKDVTNVFNSTVDFYKHNKSNLNKEDNFQLFFVLFSFGQQHKATSERFCYLADMCSHFLLREEVPGNVVDSLLMLVKKNNVHVINNIKNNAEKIIDNVLKIKIFGVSNEVLTVTKILSLFHYVPLSDSHKASLEKFATENPRFGSFVSDTNLS